MVIALRELNRFKPREPVDARAARPGAQRRPPRPEPTSRTPSSRRSATSPRARASTVEREDAHSDEVAARMGELGWYGLQIPEEYGGSGGSFLDATLFLEETARGRIPVAGYGVTLIVVGALNRFGTEEQKRDLFGRVVARRHARHRHVGARGRLGRGQPQDARPPRGRRVGARRGEDVVLLRPQGQPHPDRLPHRARRAPRGHVDDPRAARRRRHDDHADPDARRRGDQRDPPRRRARARGGAAGRARAAAGRSSWPGSTTSARSSPPRRSAWRSARSTTRSPTPRSAASSAARSAPSRPSRTASPSWPPSWPRCGCSCAGWPR